nr:response regulator [uncultured Carboxylicivirga sp.]
MISFNKINDSLYSIRALVLLFICGFITIAKKTNAEELKLYKAENIDISNKAILCMHQDDNGYLWIGTYDGLNLYNSKNIFVYRFDLQIEKSLCSNIIHKITPAEKDYLWVSTFLGLNKFSITNKEVTESHPECPEAKLICSDNEGNTCVILKDNQIQYYTPESKHFTPIKIDSLVKDDVKTIYSTKYNQFEILLSNGEIIQIELDSKSQKLIDNTTQTLHKYPITYATIAANTLYWIDSNGWIYKRIIETDQTVFISDISSLIQEYGKISQITPFQNDIYIAFISNGVLRLERNNQYKAKEVNMNIGVFSLLSDIRQNILWIGTDGQGVQMYYDKPENFQDITLNQLPFNLQKPIRTIYTENNNMWIGTKGEGVVFINNYNEFSDNQIPPNQVKSYTISNGLSSNLVFSITKSIYRDILWIGTEGPGLSYYSFDKKRVITPQNDANFEIQKVHSICETDDQTLWAATAGVGLQKIQYHNANNELIIDSVKNFSFNKNGRVCNEFHAIKYIGNSTLLIGSRGGYGLIKFNINTSEYSFIPMNSADYSAIGDVLSVYQSKDSIFYIGASSGLTKMQLLPNNQTRLIKQFDRKDGLVNDMIHGILEDTDGCIWLSTNKGLTKYNPRNDYFHNYVQDLKVTEFSDDAYFQDPDSKKLFFGGIDGLIWIDPHDFNHINTSPNLNFFDLKFAGEKVRWTDHFDSESNEITIPATVNAFSVSFVTVDNYSADNYEYSFMMEGFDTAWINLQKNNEVQFGRLPAGEYKLHIKYNNDVFNSEFNESSILIKILPPWYLTKYMKVSYTLLGILIIILFLKYLNARSSQKQKALTQKIEEEQREKLLESKLNFFTNITHELCTPLTLINGLTDQIDTHSDKNQNLRKLTSVLKSNVTNLNDLIQEILDFRRIEDTGFDMHHITSVCISDLIKDVSELFSQQIKDNNINFKVNYQDSLYWHTDSAFLKKILNNLISNAFKYSENGATIEVEAKIQDDQLILRVYNTGKGIEESQIPKLFNRFKILNDSNQQTNISTASRNGLGLSICKSLVTSLKGTIDVKSKVGEYAEFTISLPNQTDQNAESDIETDQVNKNLLLTSNNTQQTILLVDDNKDITWLISRNLSEEYNILEASSAIQALQIIKEKTPDLIITDIVMPGISGLDFVKEIKSGSYTKHIPVIIVSAKITNNEQSEGYDIGADAYLTKPFSPQLLVSIVNRLLKNKMELREYYKSSKSTYEVTDGKLIHSEDQAILKKVITIINENIESEELKPGFIADKLNMNVRSFYRYFKNVSTLSPSDFIKDFRLKHAAKLLLTTKLSVQEVIYKTGFSNKSYFYREFNKKFNMTPKEYRQKEQMSDLE